MVSEADRESKIGIHVYICEKRKGHTQVVMMEIVECCLEPTKRIENRY